MNPGNKIKVDYSFIGTTSLTLLCLQSTNLPVTPPKMGLYTVQGVGLYIYIIGLELYVMKGAGLYIIPGARANYLKLGQGRSTVKTLLE